MVEPKEAGDPVIPRVVFRTEGELLAPLVLSQRYVHKEEIGLGVVLVYVNRTASSSPPWPLTVDSRSRGCRKRVEVGLQSRCKDRKGNLFGE